MGRPESAVEHYFRNRFLLNGFMCFKFTAPGISGVPDRLVIGHGHTVFVELKAPGEEPRDLQYKTIEDMAKHGAEIYIVDSRSDVDVLIEHLKSHPRRAVKPAPGMAVQMWINKWRERRKERKNREEN